MSTATMPDTTGLKLYEINAGIAEILSRAEANDGVLSDADLDALTALEVAFPAKVESVALYIRAQLASAEVIASEEARLAGRREALEREADGLKQYLHRQLVERGERKVAGKLVTVAVQNNAPSVRVSVAASALPAPYRREIPASVEADKRALLDAYKAGAPLPDGVEIVASTNLRIR